MATETPVEPARMTVFDVVPKHPNFTTPSAIANELGMSVSYARRLLRQLADRGYIVMCARPHHLGEARWHKVTGDGGAR